MVDSIEYDGSEEEEEEEEESMLVVLRRMRVEWILMKRWCPP